MLSDGFHHDGPSERVIFRDLVAKGFRQKSLAVKVVIFRHSDQTRDQTIFLHVQFVFNNKEE